ncbi:uncharacterized protein F4812DRAFT_71997 [Daldinia caldariorum]|uniref:uncharacterized protein n=1 Tax=Daldinia caldariorum TaxID=326644 RepID=UPI0020087D33|nr:uncharacterized protein F4812DRAFT_71997 [Daldinia caldariorum]KAI1466963.1 hypothetical protein F4812DRAFT_71997 [Daldinia caldariorum]
MADATTPSASGDQGLREERLAINLPVGDVEMEDLSQTQPKPANPDADVNVSESRKHESGSVPAPIPVPDKDPPNDESASLKASGNTPTSSDDHDHDHDHDLTIDPVEPGAESLSSDLVVDIMLLLTSGARHPFRIDEKYLAKRNVTVTGKTEDGKMDPFSITVYTLKELILRDWRKEWDQPPREPSAIRLIHFGKLLEDRNQLSHYHFRTSRNVIHMTIKPQDLIDEEEAAKKVKDSGSHSGRSGCCVIL